MKGTVNILCYKSKRLSNGEHPLMICIYKDGKRKYQSLGISIQPQYWDFDKNKPKRNCPNKEAIQKLINSKIDEYNQKMLEFQLEDKDYTINKLIQEVVPVKQKITFGDFIDGEIEALINENRLKYAYTFKNLKRSILKFQGDTQFRFSIIDIEWLNSYEQWLIHSEGLNMNSIGILFRTLRVLFNKAITHKIVRQELYPFREYKVSKLKRSTAKRSLVKGDLSELFRYKTNNYYKQFALDIFVFSYFTAGINFVDIAHLTKENILDNRIVYIRKKTKKLIKIPLQPRALELINKYSNNESKYLFPILSDFHKTEIQKANRIHKIIGKTNKYLSQIGEELNSPIKLTTYVARHSFATVLKRSGVNTAIISESLGHSSEKVTQIYLDSFENSQIDEAMKNLL